LDGYRDVLERSGTYFDPGLVVQGSGTAIGAERILDLLMGLDQPPTAVFCYNDMSAIGLMRATAAIGLSVPADLSVVGFDDIPFAEYTSPALTTVAQQKAEMGRRAVEMALELISTPTPAGSEFSDQVFEGYLVLRESTAAYLDSKS
jgi:DNA-binding LacI/PurR family transcriptional regulator